MRVVVSSSLLAQICLEEYTPNDWVKMLPCQHKFHEDCILRWFKDHVICPMCRFDCKADAAGEGGHHTGRLPPS